VVWLCARGTPSALTLEQWNHTPLMLSALATSAVQGFQAVSAQSLSTPERDAALVHDVNNLAWLIEIPLSDADALAHSEELSATRALTEGLRSRLPFQVPSVSGTTQVGERTLSVSAYLPGSHLTAQNVTPVSAASFWPGPCCYPCSPDQQHGGL